MNRAVRQNTSSEYYKHEGKADRIAEYRIPFRVPADYSKDLSLPQKVAFLLATPIGDPLVGKVVAEGLVNEAREFTVAVLREEAPEKLLAVHQTLFQLYEARLANPLSSAAHHSSSPWFNELLYTIEEPWIEWEIRQVTQRLPSEEDASDAERLCAWFRRTAADWSNMDKSIARYLEERADKADFDKFILSDSHLNFRFYDALVLSALHYSESVKNEISHHLWDECGNGDKNEAHTVQYHTLLTNVGLGEPLIPIWDDWRPYAGFNLYFALGFNRRHYFKSVGSLAMPELFDPERDAAVVKGLERLGLNPKKEFEYFYNHMVLDAEHGDQWLEGVVTPIVEAEPRAGLEMATGAILRMVGLNRYNEYLATIFGIQEEVPAA